MLGVSSAAAAAVAGPPAGRIGSLVFGDFDSKTYQHLNSDSDGEPTSSSSSSKQQSQSRRHARGAAHAATAAAAAAGEGEVFKSCMSDSDQSDTAAAAAGDSGSDSGSESSSSSSSSAGGSTSDIDAPEEEGVSLRSQLLLGYLLMLAAGSAGSAASSSSGTAAAAEAGSSAAGGAAASNSAAGGSSTLVSSSSSSSAKGVLPPASLPLLASHLRQAGLLPKWVHWLLQQLPQRPELFDRAFLRLFQKVSVHSCGDAAALLVELTLPPPLDRAFLRLSQKVCWVLLEFAWELCLLLVACCVCVARSGATDAQAGQRTELALGLQAHRRCVLRVIACA